MVGMSQKNIRWNEDYALGIDHIDTQHKHLFEIVNKIYALKDNAHVKEGIKNILYELNEYMQEHFDDEEAYMEKIGFPELPEHRLLHANIITQLSQFVRSPNHRLDILQTKMRVMAKRLLIDHIIYEDMKIKQYVESSSMIADENEDADIIEL